MARGSKKNETKKEKKVLEVGNEVFKLRAVWLNPDTNSDMVAVCTLRVLDALSINFNLRYTSKNGGKYYISFPSYKKKDNTYQSQIIPCNKDVAAELADLASKLGSLIEEEEEEEE